MKAIIIDDEKRARHLLRTYIKNDILTITETYEAENLALGVELIKQHHPEIVFLDIQMPQESGLRILKYFNKDEINFKIIFITAFNQYAIDAFKLSASNYLLKPLDVEALKTAVIKAQKELETINLQKEFSRLKNVIEQLSSTKIALEVPKGIMFASHDDIIYFEGDGMYTKIYFKDNSYKTICKPLKHFIEQLKEQEFFYNCHRSYFVNINYIKEITRNKGDFIIMSNNEKVPISKTKKDSFLTVINRIFFH